MKYLIFISSAMLFGQSLYASALTNPQITYFSGIQILSYDVTSSGDSSISSADAPTSDSYTQVPLGLDLEFSASNTTGVFFRGLSNIVSSGLASASILAVGSNFYFKTIGKKTTFKEENYSMEIIPNWRFYWGIQLGISFFNYPTLEDLSIKQSSDIQFIPGGQVGGYWHINNTFSLRGELSGGIAFGSKTSGMALQLLIGLSHMFDDIL